MTKQYEALMAYDGVELVYEKDALEAVADKAIEMKIGARGLRSVMEGIMTDIMYTVPRRNTQMIQHGKTGRCPVLLRFLSLTRR